MHKILIVNGDICKILEILMRYAKKTCQLKEWSIFYYFFIWGLQQFAFQKQLNDKKVQKKHVNKTIKCILLYHIKLIFSTQKFSFCGDKS